jgi:hypothetical protein
MHAIARVSESKGIRHRPTDIRRGILIEFLHDFSVSVSYRAVDTFMMF